MKRAPAESHPSPPAASREAPRAGARGRRAWLAPGTALLVAALALLLAGCVTSARYRLAKPGLPPAPELDLAQSEPPLELKLRSVIVFEGPGSWKQEARWDEYVVQLVNHGAEPIVLQSAAVTDVNGRPAAPGDDPWKLEQLSRSNWDKYGKAGLAVVAGAGAAAAYVAAVTSVATASLGGMFGAATTGAAAGAAPFALALIPVVAVADISVVAVMNHRNKLGVQREFQRRRLPLPYTLAPGESVTASLFFPMTPGPQRLSVDGRVGSEPLQAALGLGPLAGLHLKTLK